MKTETLVGIVCVWYLSFLFVSFRVFSGHGVSQRWSRWWCCCCSSLYMGRELTLHDALGRGGGGIERYARIITYNRTALFPLSRERLVSVVSEITLGCTRYVGAHDFLWPRPEPRGERNRFLDLPRNENVPQHSQRKCKSPLGVLKRERRKPQTKKATNFFAKTKQNKHTHTHCFFRCCHFSLFYDFFYFFDC